MGYFELNGNPSTLASHFVPLFLAIIHKKKKYYSLGLRLEAAYTNFPSPNKSKAVGTKQKSFIYQLTQLGPVMSFIF